MKIYITIIALSLLVLSCSESTDVNYNDEISSLGSLSVKESIAKANEWRTLLPKITSYVTTEKIYFEFPDGREVTKNLPDDEMYIAISPYITYTHSCTNHYISTCKAELVNKEFYVEASSDNNTYVNQNITSMDNGFIELWLPRNKTIEIEIKYGSKSCKETITTNKDSKTCYTTFFLE
jgi:hypothetical protein